MEGQSRASVTRSELMGEKGRKDAGKRSGELRVRWIEAQNF